MTKGDKIKLRAELAGKAMQALLGTIPFKVLDDDGEISIYYPNSISAASVEYADALMAELGISLDKED